MKMVSMHEAKSQLSRLVKAVELGENVVIARRNVPVARLVPVDVAEPKRRFGVLKGKIKLDDSFFDPLPETELDAWEGR